MTKQRPSKRVAYTWIAMGLILAGGIALVGAGRRGPERSSDAVSAGAAPRGEITPGLARADVDTLDLQLD